jgi:acyl dehydratase
MAINYGLNRVRFVAPVPVGSRIRGRFRPLSIEEAGGAVQVVWAVTVERDGSDKPCAVVEWVVRYYPTDQR